MRKAAQECYPEGFAAFWERYPHRVAKQDALKAWAQTKPTPELLTLMIDALDWQCRQAKWRDVEFIPYPASWLRGRRWEDERPRLHTKIVVPKVVPTNEPL